MFSTNIMKGVFMEPKNLINDVFFSNNTDNDTQIYSNSMIEKQFEGIADELYEVLGVVLDKYPEIKEKARLAKLNRSITN